MPPIASQALYAHPLFAPIPPIASRARVEGALQLLSNRHMKIRFAHVHERVLLLRYVELLTAITSDLPMKPEKTRNTRLAESKLNPPFIMSRSTKVISTC